MGTKCQRGAFIVEESCKTDLNKILPKLGNTYVIVYLVLLKQNTWGWTLHQEGKGGFFIIILETKDPRSVAPSGEPQFTDASSDWSIPVGSNLFAMMIRTSPSRW